ncbi:MAG: V-type ATP synthase subunit E [Bacteroidetes bacterium ADurb.Bin174]|nr:MAG: V-type ATP synthase subunit E [Bacteroidetes bacterium ADurb.Bin174]
MNTKLQELTDKIYLEGIEKGQEEAAKIIAQAEQQAADIVAKAQKQADKTLKSAEEKANELMKNTQVEIKLFAQQALNALKTEITDIVCGEVVSSNVKAATANKEFMMKILLVLTESLAKNQVVTIETRQAKELTDYFKSNAKHLLDKGVKITAVNNIKTDFSIVAEKGGYKINFGEAEFIAYFKEFLRPQLVELLF